MKTDTYPIESLPSHYSVGLNELIAIIWRRKLCLALCLVAAFALGGVYFVKADRLYEVKCRLLVEKQDLPVGEITPSQRAIRDLEFLGTQAEILGSPAVIALVVDKIQWPVPSAPGVSPVGKLKDKISVRPVMGTNVLSISLQADDAERAVQATEALVDSYRTYMSQVNHDVHVDVLAMLAKSEKEVRADLNQLEEKFRQLREQSPLIAGYKNGSDVQLAHVDQLQRQLADTRNRRVELENQLRIASLEDPKSRSIAASGSRATFVNTDLVDAGAIENEDTNQPLVAEASPVHSRLAYRSQVGANLPGARDMVAIQNRIMQARVLEKELYTRFGHKHPEVKAVEEQIASLLVEEQKALQAGHELLRRELETVVANEKQLSELCKDELDQTKVLEIHRLEQQQMTGQLARVQEVHTSILGQLRQWKLTDQIASDGRSPVRITVLEAPVVPLNAAWPSPRILFGLSGAVGLVAGLGLIAVLEQRAKKVDRIPQTQECLVASLPIPAMQMS